MTRAILAQMPLLGFFHQFSFSRLFVCLFANAVECVGGTVSIDCRRCLINGGATHHNTLETVEATAYGTYEIDLFGSVHICDRYIAMATAHRRFDGWYFMWNRFNYNNGPIPEHYNQIWTQSEGKSLGHFLMKIRFSCRCISCDTM